MPPMTEWPEPMWRLDDAVTGPTMTSWEFEDPFVTYQSIELLGHHETW